MNPGPMSEAAAVIAIDIGGGSTKLALVNRKGAISGWHSFKTVASSGAALLERVVAASRRLQTQAEQPIAGISAAVAGFVTPQGELEYNPNLPWLERIPIAAILAGELGLDVLVDADSNAACVAEYIYGRGRGSERFLCLTGGTGLGVGMMVEGKLLRIAHGCMGDAGHVIVSPEGPACSCGGHGCAEAMLSTAVLAKRYAEIIGCKDAGFRAIVEDAQSNKPAALELLKEAGYWLGIASASLANIFFPDRIAVAGGLSQAGDALMISAQASFRSHGGQLPLTKASLVRSTTGEHATLLGAAASFFHPELL
ncbi:Xylose-responsive transcription regulator, ROK family [Acidisarcina polymorpha]|uniref:Xylose-responsive transcription regulator, ROK family n=2 Tax=Acidisarcina polymorpha TaxID=2211140 RepID=A0A2Z5G4Z1_9BACT|nr:Xylose-responsive transcription regulator, ROK family [Acidisarcina polymorpha]